MARWWRGGTQRRRGFTLIELLVVVSIIAILAAMLLPALGKARAKVRTAACGGTMRNLGVGLQMYADEHRTFIPVMEPNNNLPWWPARLYPYIGDERMFRCSVAKGLYGANAEYANQGYPGGWSVDNNATPLVAPYWTTFHANRMAAWTVTGWANKRGFFVAGTPGNWTATLNDSVVNPDTIYLVDGKIQMWSHPAIQDETTHMPDYMGPATHVGYYHEGGFNALFAGGHVQVTKYGTTRPAQWSIETD